MMDQLSYFRVFATFPVYLTAITHFLFEIALKYRADAYRTIYAVQIEEAIWVIHAFKKKSKTGIKTPKQEIDLVKQRIKAVKESVSPLVSL